MEKIEESNTDAAQPITKHMSEIVARLHAAEDARTRFLNMAANMPGMLFQFILYPDGSHAFSFISEGCRSIFGYAPERIERDPRVVLDCIPDEARDEFLLQVERSAASLSPFLWAGRITPSDGGQRWIEIESRPHAQSDGSVLWDGVVMDGTARRVAEETLARRARQQASVALLGQRALSGIPLDTLLSEATEIVAQTFDTAFCEILEYLPGRREFLVRSGRGWHSGVADRPLADTGERVWPECTLQAGTSVVVPDVAADTRFEVAPHLRDHGIASGLSAIIGGKEQPFGILAVYSRRPREYCDEDIDFAEAVTTVLGTAIVRGRAERLARGQAEALERTLRTISAQPELGTINGQVLSAAAEQMEAPFAVLWLCSDQGDSVHPHMQYQRGQVEIPDEASRSDVDPCTGSDDPIWRHMRETAGTVVVECINEDERLRDLAEYRDSRVFSFVRVPLVQGNEIVGWLSLGYEDRHRFRAEDVELAEALARQVSLAVHITRLAEQGRQGAVLAERNRMAREIHDTLAQGFTGIVIQLDVAEMTMDQEPEATREHLAAARDLARASLNEARRSVWALRPSALEKNGLASALDSLARQMTAGSGIHVTLTVHGEIVAASSDTEANLLRIGLEALTNALKHSEADRIEIELRYSASGIRLAIRDNGIGFDVDRAGRTGGFGLVSMRERAQAMTGDLSVRSRPGHGTEVTAVATIRRPVKDKTYGEKGARD